MLDIVSESKRQPHHDSSTGNRMQAYHLTDQLLHQIQSQLRLQVSKQGSQRYQEQPLDQIQKPMEGRL